MAEVRLQRRLAAILSADVVGSARTVIIHPARCGRIGGGIVPSSEKIGSFAPKAKIQSVGSVRATRKPTLLP